MTSLDLGERTVRRSGGARCCYAVMHR